MTYQSPQPRLAGEIRDDLLSIDEETVQRGLIDGAHFLPGDWIQPRAVSALQDDRIAVRRTAIVALSVLARRRLLRLDAVLWTTLSRLKHQTPTSGFVEDLLDDIEIYCPDELPPPPPA